MWATACRILEDFKILNTRYPIEARLLSKKTRPNPFLRVAARIHCDAAASSFLVQFELTGEEVTASDLDLATSEIGCGVEVQFGNVECVYQ